MTPLLRNLLFAVGAVALFAGVVIGIYWLRQGQSPRSQAAAEAGVAVIVASRPIPAGGLLRQEDMSWRDLRGARAPAGSFVRGASSESELIGAVATRPFAPGEILSSGGVLRPDQRGFLAATLSPGHRAVTISVDAPQSASGLVLPGDRVDVILVQDMGDVSPRRRFVGETVLQNARIVAVGRAFNASPTATPQAKAKAAETAENAPKTITLEALPADAERLYVANRLGKLELALRSLAAPDLAGAPIGVTPAVWAGDVSRALGDGGPAAPTAQAPAAADARRPATIRRTNPPVLILRGAN